ncbi:MAG: glycoside hydrolase family 36 protein [Longimicrobiales bacterium]
MNIRTRPGKQLGPTGRALVVLVLAVLSAGADEGRAQNVEGEDPLRFVLAGQEVEVEGSLGGFNLTVTVDEVEAGVEVARLRLENETLAVPPPFSLTWSVPAHDVHGVWTTATRFGKSLGPDWGMTTVRSMLAREAPVMALFGSDDGNRLTFSVSDALNTVVLRSGVREEDARVYAGIDLFTERHRAVTEVEVEVRFDRRPGSFVRSLGDVADWWAAHPGYTPASVPALARLPMYSTWYSYHQSVDTQSLLGEARVSKELGYEAIIVDDGWQTLDSKRGYAFTGDWEPERMPDMKAFVEGVHSYDMKVLLWYAMSLVGEQSKVFPQFEGKYLRYWDGQGAYVLDPRYPEVREHIIDTYRTAMREWGVDGFKLDFVGFFVATDSTVLEATDGRDFASVDRATDRLMTDVMAELKKLNPSVLIEFRQRYIGPLMRKYGNMFRAGDSPGAAVDNRVRTVDLRLLSGNTAVHSDMFMWHYDEPVEVAALQLLNIMFSVPQLSVRLEEIPQDHREMVTFYTDYWRTNAAVLLDGDFDAKSPLANYPLVSATTNQKRIVGLYGDQVVTLDDTRGTDAIDVLNGKASRRVILDPHLPLGEYTYVVRDALGRETGSGSVTLDRAPVGLDVPPSGMLALTRRD